MARRSDHSREELKNLAIAAGLKIIEKEGFAHFSARRVAAEIGYTVGTLYHVFGTYDELVLNINARTLDHWFEAMEKAAARSKIDPVLFVARFYIKYSKEHFNSWSALFEHRLAEGTPLPDWYVPKLARFFIMVEAMLLPKVKNDAKKAKRAARVLWSGIHGICILFMAGKLDMVNAESPEVLADSFVKSYMAGLSHV